MALVYAAIAPTKSPRLRQANPSAWYASAAVGVDVDVELAAEDAGFTAPPLVDAAADRTPARSTLVRPSLAAPQQGIQHQRSHTGKRGCITQCVLVRGSGGGDDGVPERKSLEVELGRAPPALQTSNRTHTHAQFDRYGCLLDHWYRSTHPVAVALPLNVNTCCCPLAVPLSGGRVGVGVALESIRSRACASRCFTYSSTPSRKEPCAHRIIKPCEQNLNCNSSRSQTLRRSCGDAVAPGEVTVLATASFVSAML